MTEKKTLGEIFPMATDVRKEALDPAAQKAVHAAHQFNLPATKGDIEDIRYLILDFMGRINQSMNKISDMLEAIKQFDEKP